MTYRIALLSPAKADLLRLNAFLAEKSHLAALRAMDAIDEGLRSLSDLPARTVSETSLHELYLRFGDSGYVIYYRIDGSTVVIARIFHMREGRDAPTIQTD